jgi:Zinc finger, C3HC4 type (RING finger)
MNQPLVHPSWGSISAVVGAERSSTDHPEPSSRASTSLSTSVSDIASELCRSSPSIGTFTPSPPGLGPSTGIFYPQNINRLPERPPQQEPPTSHFPNATYPTYVSGAGAGASSAVAYASSAVQTPPPVPLSPLSPSPPLPVPPRAARHVPVTPAHRGVHARSQSQSQLQSHQVVPQVPPSSARSKVSVAETPSGDLANFHLLKGSPLQSVADFDTPTPSPRTPSMPSVSPADAQAFALAAHGGSLPALTADRRFWPGSSVSPSVSRTHRVLRSSFYCRICRADPCHEITATACGHVFCNACIVEEVRENARCPVCNTAVLLFAMLKLDLS